MTEINSNNFNKINFQGSGKNIPETFDKSIAQLVTNLKKEAALKLNDARFTETLSQEVANPDKSKFADKFILRISKLPEQFKHEKDYDSKRWMEAILISPEKSEIVTTIRSGTKADILKELESDKLITDLLEKFKEMALYARS